MNPKLSILIPAIPGRFDRLRAIISRCSLSMKMYNNKYPGEKLSRDDVEFVVVDGGSHDETKEMCVKVGEYHRMKYIFVPIGKFINAAYPRNVGLRVCQGDVIGHLDVDHFPSENIIEGMLRPFVEGGLDRPIINRGYVIDSSKSPLGAGPNIGWLEQLNAVVLSSSGMRCQIDDLYKQAQIPPPGVNNTLWVWAVAKKRIDMLNGYDEQYCRKWAYSKEDDDVRERWLAQGLSFYDGHNKQFCAIHLWHPAAQRNIAVNNLNKEYFQKTCNPVKSVCRNEQWEWGKLIDGSFSVIEGVVREVEEHEQWISKNQSGPSYNNCWNSVDHFVEVLR